MMRLTGTRASADAGEATLVCLAHRAIHVVQANHVIDHLNIVLYSCTPMTQKKSDMRQNTGNAVTMIQLWSCCNVGLFVLVST